MTTESPITVNWASADSAPASRVTAISARLGMPTRDENGALTPDGIELLLGDIRVVPGHQSDDFPVTDIHRLFFSRGRLQEVIDILTATADQYDKYDSIVQEQASQEGDIS